MPLNRVPLTGNQIVAMANVSRQEKTEFTSVGTFSYSELNVLGLPSLMYHVQLISPVANVRAYPLFAVSNITAGGAPTPNWASFDNGTVLVPGSVSVFTIRAAVAVIGIRIVIDPPLAPFLPIYINTILTAGG